MRIVVSGIFLFIVSFNYGYAQDLDKNKSYEVFCAGFYNVENLYDTIDQPLISDEEFTPIGINRWDGPKYWKKIEHLSEVLSQLGIESTPDGAAVIGLCEVESRSCLEDLIHAPALSKRKYSIVHYDGPDQRGVDVAFLFQPKYFKLISSRAVKITLTGDDARPTRDELLVSGEMNGERMHFIVCHWPSRRGGEKKSAPKRMTAALTAKSIIDSIYKSEPSAKIVLMGDLNDDPDSKSIVKGLVTVPEKRQIHQGQMYNCMLGLFERGIGTLAYNDTWNLFDQMIVTPELIRFDFNSYRFYNAKIFNKPFLKQEYGNFKGYPFRTYAGGIYNGGYSDHFPVYTFFVREKK